jgi:hypothetical protein
VFSCIFINIKCTENISHKNCTFNKLNIFCVLIFKIMTVNFRQVRDIVIIWGSLFAYSIRIVKCNH